MLLSLILCMCPLHLLADSGRDQLFKHIEVEVSSGPGYVGLGKAILEFRSYDLRGRSIRNEWAREGIITLHLDDGSYLSILGLKSEGNLEYGVTDSGFPGIRYANREKITQQPFGSDQFEATDDTYIVSGTPTANFGNLSFMDAGWDPDASTRITDSYVKIENFSIGGGQLTNMSLDVLVQSCPGGAVPLNSQIAAHQVTGNWNESSLTWNNRPAFLSSDDDIRTISSCPSGLVWDVTDSGEIWLSNPGSNNGIVLRQQSPFEDFTLRFLTKEAGASNAPLFFVQFDPPQTYDLDVVSSGSPSVPIIGNPNSFNGTTNYSVTDIAEGTGLQLIAPEFNGAAEFQSWSDCDSVSGQGSVNCNIVMNANRVVTANYQIPAPTYTLTVTSSGAANIFIDADPFKFAGTTNYTVESIKQGQSITLEAVPNQGSIPFLGWTGCDSTSGIEERLCSINVSTDRTVTARYGADVIFSDRFD